jgi:hypothetical protein
MREDIPGFLSLRSAHVKPYIMSIPSQIICVFKGATYKPVIRSSLISSNICVLGSHKVGHAIGGWGGKGEINGGMSVMSSMRILCPTRAEKYV